MMLTQNEMYKFLKENLPSHEIKIEDNKVIGNRLIKSRSFSSFKISYLKNGSLSIKTGTANSQTLRYNNVLDLFCFMGCISYFKDHKDYKELLGLTV